MFDLVSRWFGPRSRRRYPSAPRRNRVRPRLEQLEDRLAPAVYNVNTLLDPSIAAGVNNATGVISGTSGIVSLRSAIQAANNTSGAGNTINLTLAGAYLVQLAPTTANETDNQAGEFSIYPTTPNANLTIINASGGPAAVDANNLTRAFDINASNTNNPAAKFTVGMTGFTIENGRAFDATGANPDAAAASGGGIRDQGNQSLTLTNIVLANNSATADGGGVSMENTVDTPWTLRLTNTMVANNQAGDAGGGVETDGSGRVVITDSTITGNTTVNQGAGIWLDAIGNDSAILTITGSTISNNTALNGPTGGIGNAGNNTFVPATGPTVNGAVTITGSTVANNFSGGTTTGGGGFGDENGLGTLVVLNSTFVGNSSTPSGGGIQENGPSTTINDGAIIGNTTLHEGGGLDITSAAFTLNNTVVAGNFSNAGGMNFAGVDPDVVGAVTTGSGNFIGIGGPGLTGITNGANGNRIGTAAAPINPLLGPLQNNGGPTLTEAPLPGSPVIDAGVNSAIPAGAATDQRGFPRVISGSVDIGAFEFQDVTLAVNVQATTPSVLVGATATFAIVLTNTSPNALPLDNSTVTVTLSSGLTAAGPLSFALGALAPGQSATFMVTAVAAASGEQSIVVAINGIDINPSFITTGAAILVTPPPPPPQLPPFVSVAFGPSGEVLELVNSAGVLTQFDAAGAHVLGGGVRSASVAFAGGSEVLDVVTLAGALVQFDASGAHMLTGGGVLSAGVAFGPFGEVLEVVGLDGTLTQFDAAGAHVLGGGFRSAGIAFNGGSPVLDVVTTAGVLTQFDAAGAHTLGGGVRAAGVAFLNGQEVIDLITLADVLFQFDAAGAHNLGQVG